MIERIKEGAGFEYKKLTEEEKSNRKILGRLVGPIADCLKPTRNGRLYSEELWERVFDNPIMKEKFKNKVLYGELGHPAERAEIDPEKIAVCMSEPPKKNSKGQLEAVFDILDTPNGRILKTLCDYGSTLGISSRGQGEVMGDDSVDPDTYECECWDIVIVPAVESARLSYVNESLESKKKISLTEALAKDIEESSADDQVIMKKTLDELEINIESDDENREDKSTTSEVSKNELEAKDEEADNVRSDHLVESLQEVIKAKSDLEAKLQSLQSELAVSNTKVDELNEKLSSYKTTTARLSDLANKGKEAAKDVSILEAKLKEKEESIKILESKVNELISSNRSAEKSLTESISSKDVELSKMNETLSSLREEFEAAKRDYADKVNKLAENYAKKEAELTSSIKDLTQKIVESKNLAEGYKRAANNVTNAYIVEKATMLGCSKEDIIKRLPKKYTLKDVNTICESLKKYNLNINKLPFNVAGSINKVTITESSEDTIRTRNPMVDDEVDDMLLSLVNTNK